MTGARPSIGSQAGFSNPHDAAAALGARVAPVETVLVPWREAAGRVLGETVTLDRPSPALDVSAMDGYAVRVEDAGSGALPVGGETPAGTPPMRLGRGEAIRVSTGAPIPEGADAVIPRELVVEHPDRIEISERSSISPGDHIRHRGENGDAGRTVAAAGQSITPPVLASITSTGRERVRVFRALRVGVVCTGDEVVRAGDTPEAWQLRDGNASALEALLRGAAWIGAVDTRRVRDDPKALESEIGTLLESCDAILLSGGVSVGDHDHVPRALRALDVQTVFHGLPIRPGKPVLGGVTRDGRPVLGLPGNPVSTLVTARVLAIRALRARAGVAEAPGWSTVEVQGDARAPASLTWFALCRLGPGESAQLIPGRGSGDWVAAPMSDGLVEVPPGEAAAGRRRFIPWGITGGTP